MSNDDRTERFVDESEKTLAPASTWDTLPLGQLLETKSELEGKLWAFRNNPAYATPLQTAINRLQVLITERSNSF